MLKNYLSLTRPLTIPTGKSYPVECKETRKRFGSIQEAAKWAGITPQRMSRSILLDKPVKGLNFQKI